MGITRINNNIAALNAQRNIGETGANLGRSIERLSSGLRINRAGDDAAGLSVANRLRTQRQGLDVAVSNAQDGTNVIKVAEGALEETTTRLNRIRALAVQAANTGVNDFGARSAIQDEIFQSIDEITRIANTTQFSNNFLLNGDFSINSQLKRGTVNPGLSINPSPVASNLNNGTSFLNIQQTREGFKQIVSGDAIGGPQVLNTGIIEQEDIAVTMAFFGDDRGFSAGVTGLTGGDNLADNAFNGVSMQATDIITFEGVLSDGVTRFIGSLSVAGNDMDALSSAITNSIRDAERALFGVSTIGSVSNSFRTAVNVGTGDNAGRLQLESFGNYINQSSINIRLFRGGDLVTQSNGVTRSGAIGDASSLSGQGSVGNNVQAITGSTFGDGSFRISVEDVQQAQQRTLESTITFRDGNGTIIDRTLSLEASGNTNTVVLNGSFVNGIYTGGTSLTDGSTITLLGTNADGTTFQGIYTYRDADTTGINTDLNDFEFSNISGLIMELNYRTRDYAAGTETNGVQTRFEDAMFTFTTGGNLRLVDDLGRDNSQLSFTLTFNGTAGNGAFTLQDDAELNQEGFFESATFRIEGGDAIRARAGDVVTLRGETSTTEGVPTPQMTFRVGSSLTTGEDVFKNLRNEYVGRLNGGEGVKFNAGDTGVVFFTKSTANETSRFVTVNFDSIVDVTSDFTGADPGKTVLISTVNRGLNFQVGANAGQALQFAIGDLKADNLGFGRGSGRTIKDIDVTNLEGANEAMRIVDEALNQVSRTRSILGAATNRLEATIANLSVASENLTASESRIRDADIAAETTQFALNQVLLQAGVSVLAQANFQSQGFLQLLG